MTNEFNFDVKHEDYEEWLNQIEQVSDADCFLLSESDPYVMTTEQWPIFSWARK